MTARKLPIDLGMFRLSLPMLLAALLLMIVAAPIAQQSQFGDFIEAALVTLVLVASVLAVGGRHKTLLLAAILITPAVVGKWMNHYHRHLLPGWFVAVAGVVPLIFTVIMLFRFILGAKRVNGEVLCAAISNYLLIAFVWCFAYDVVIKLSPDAFAFTNSTPATHRYDLFEMFYFSCMTLATVGYGDITPVTGAARTLAILEAMSGTFYMAMLVARLVAMYSAEKRAAHTSANEGRSDKV